MNFAALVSRLMDNVADDLADMVDELAREGMAEMDRVQRQLRNQARRRRPAVATPTTPAAAVVKRSRRRAAPGQSQARQAPPPPPPAAAPGPSAIDIATAACILGEFTGIAPSDIVKDETTRKRAIRAAALKCHPDAKGGNHDAMVKVTWAMKIFDPRNQRG